MDANLTAALDFMEEILAVEGDKIQVPARTMQRHAQTLVDHHRPRGIALDRDPQGDVRSVTQKAFMQAAALYMDKFELTEYTDSDGQVCPAVEYTEGRDRFTREVNALLMCKGVRTRVKDDGKTFVVFCK